jgi:predicted MFS family arabinose efflux permease
LRHPTASSFALLRIADYRRLWAIGGLSGIARWLEFVALAIFAFELTRSPELVALLSVLRMLPYVALGLVVGALADIFDRKHILVFSLLVMALVSVTMAGLTAAHMAGYAAAAAATMFSGAFWTIDMPARRHLLVGAVGTDRMTAALALDNATMYASRAIGPLLGGLTYELVGIQGIFALISGCYVICVVLAGRVGAKAAAIDEPHANGDAIARPAPAGFGRRIRDRLLPPRTLIRNRRFQVLMGVTLVYNLWCFPFVGMVPVIAQKDFGLTPFLVGALSACDGLGGMIGALIVGALVTERTLFRFHFLGALSFLLLVAALAWYLTVGAAIAVLLLLGLSAASFSATQFALVYVISPPEMRGRATGVLSLCIGSSMLGHYHTGYLFEHLGSVSAMLVMAVEGSLALLVLSVLWWWSSATPPQSRPALTPVPPLS